LDERPANPNPPAQPPQTFALSATIIRFFTAPSLSFFFLYLFPLKTLLKHLVYKINLFIFAV
jgi:hypothetical protein